MTKKERKELAEAWVDLHSALGVLHGAHEYGYIDLDAPHEHFPKGLRFAYRSIQDAYSRITRLNATHDRKQA